MEINIKELAKAYFKNRLSLTVEDVEHIFQDIYDEGKKSSEQTKELKQNSN